MRRLFFILLALFAFSATVDAQTPNQNILRMNSTPGFDTSKAPIDLDYATGQYWLQGATGPQTDTRASAATCQDGAGTWHAIASLALPTCSGTGVWPYEARTNGIRNNTMQGAVVGTARTISGCTTASRTASASAVFLCSNTGGAAVNDLATIAGWGTATYNGSWLVTAVTSNVSITVATATSATDTGGTAGSVAAVSPGTMPTNWGVNTLNNLARTIVSFGVSSAGSNYVDILFAGYPTTAGYIQIGFEAGNAISALYGQTLDESFFYEFISSPTNVQGIRTIAQGLAANGSSIEESFVGTLDSSLSQSWIRYQSNFTLANYLSVFVQPSFRIAIPTTQAYTYFEIRFAWPQLENNSLINSTVAAGAQTVTNSGTSGCASGTYTVSGGTGTAATLTGVASGGVIASLTTLAAGSYTVFPPSPAALTGTGCSGSPTTTLTPTNNAALAFATPPILTSGSAVVRAADNISLPIQTMNGNISPYGIGTPAAPTTSSTSQILVQADDGTNNNKFQLFRTAVGAAATVNTTISGSSTSAAGAAWAQSTQGKLSGNSLVNLIQGSFNNGSIFSATPTGRVAGINKLHIGVNAATGTSWNGSIARVTVSPQSLLGY